MTPQLRTITIKDFRSLRGTVTVPLQAPVILIHGPNGAGKTSVLSAIELALTGELLAMRRTDPLYQSHLLHRGAEFGTIALTTTGDNGQITRDMVVKAGGLEGPPLLEGDANRFFSERCYLAQATLGRLLEIYQNARAREDSPLTRFVKDLLGLDHLDALIDGLQPAGDVRNTRKLVPDYAEVEKAQQTTNNRLAENKVSLKRLADEASTIQSDVRQALSAMSSTAEQIPNLELPGTVETLLATDTEERELITLTGYRRELASLRQRAALLVTSAEAIDLAAAEAEEQAARATLDEWWQGPGKSLEALIEELRSIFPDLPSAVSTDPELAFNTASERIEAELDRCRRLMARDDTLLAKLGEHGQAVERSRARITIIDEQLSQVTGETEGLSRALAAMVPHIHSDDCPVCGRDYREISSEPLVSRVSSKVAQLTEQADRLRSLGKTRREASDDLTRAERDREAALGQRLTPDASGALKARIADLSDASRRLTDVAALAQLGVGVIRREVEARQRLAELRSRDLLATELRIAVDDLCRALNQLPLDTAEPIADAIRRLEIYVTMCEANLKDRQRIRLRALEQHRLLTQKQSEIRDLQQLIADDMALKAQLDPAFEVAERRRSAARALSRAATDARTAIVGRVFNSALNKIWRDLFVRLAPTEPFVPAFRLPQTANEPVTAQLETVHREGGRGGSPGAMLSAGNLNTAALTLFLALHLSMKPLLPWLILDDPVQSMDEVHIAQFAALLRTLSKEHGRQLLITVHDRPLFDYLTLELSPAFPGDRLITVELRRSHDGATIAEPTFHEWQPDRAVAA